MAMYRCGSGVGCNHNIGSTGTTQFKLISEYKKDAQDSHASYIDVHMWKGKKKVTISHNNTATDLESFGNPRIWVADIDGMIHYKNEDDEYLNGYHNLTSFSTLVGFLEVLDDEIDLQFGILASPLPEYFTLQSQQLSCVIKIEDI